MRWVGPRQLEGVPVSRATKVVAFFVLGIVIGSSLLYYRSSLWDSRTPLLLLTLATVVASRWRIHVSQLEPYFALSASPVVLFMFLEIAPQWQVVGLWAIGMIVGDLLSWRERDAVLSRGAASALAAIATAIVWVYLPPHTDSSLVLNLASSYIAYLVIIIAAYLLRSVIGRHFRFGFSFRDLNWLRVGYATALNIALGVCVILIRQSISRAVSETSDTPILDSLIISAFVLTIAMVALWMGQRVVTLQRRLRGLKLAAHALPWDRHGDVLEGVKKQTAIALDAGIVQTSADGPLLKSISAPITFPDGHSDQLVAKRGPGSAPFTYVDQEALEIMARIGTEVLRVHDIIQTLQTAANTDALTGLLNYGGFHTVVTDIDRQRPGTAEQVALIYIDLDNFKQVNDEYGHAIGDQVLKFVANRMRRSIRPQDLVARVGGDEFVIVLRQMPHEQKAWDLAGRIRTEITQIIEIEGNALLVTLSIGLAYSSSDKESLASLITVADERMYDTRRFRRDRDFAQEPTGTQKLSSALLPSWSQQLQGHQISSPKFNQYLREQIVHGIANLVYQPIIRLEDDTVVGVETLTRCDNVAFPGASASMVIHEVKRMGMLDQFTENVLVQAFLDVSHMHKVYPGLSCFSINIDIEQLDDSGFFTMIEEHILQYPDITLCVEVGERSMNLASTATIERLYELKKKNVLISLDDFGMAYSGVKALLEYPFDILKLDKSIVNASNRERSSTVISSIAQMCHRLGATVIAEGVEHRQFANALQNHGVNYGQGFGLARPMTLEHIVRWLTNRANSNEVDPYFTHPTNQEHEHPPGNSSL